MAVVLSRQAGGRPLLVAWCVPAAEEKEEEGEDAARGGGGGDYIGIDSGGTAVGHILPPRISFPLPPQPPLLHTGLWMEWA